ncbi:hypothetical protein BH24ACT3_BH24ACT3_11450 [soil metagenome]
MTSTDTTENTEPEEVTKPPETPTQPEAAPTPGATEDGTEEPSEGTDGTEEGAGREAAKYRRKLRDTEAERDTLRGQVEGLQRAEAERIAGQHITKPEGMWAGVELADLLDEAGAVDGEKVNAAAKDARERFGLRSKLDGNVVPREGSNPPPPRAGGFADALG